MTDSAELTMTSVTVKHNIARTAGGGASFQDGYTLLTNGLVILLGLIFALDGAPTQSMGMTN